MIGSSQQEIACFQKSIDTHTASAFRWELLQGGLGGRYGLTNRFIPDICLCSYTTISDTLYQTSYLPDGFLQGKNFFSFVSWSFLLLWQLFLGVDILRHGFLVVLAISPWRFCFFGQCIVNCWRLLHWGLKHKGAHLSQTAVWLHRRKPCNSVEGFPGKQCSGGYGGAALCCCEGVWVIRCPGGVVMGRTIVGGWFGLSPSHQNLT